MHPLVRIASPAKLNLALQLLGKRESDGYHLLDSLVVSADLGMGNDVLEMRPADAWSLNVSGPLAAGVPEDSRNLVLKAAIAAHALYPHATPYAIHLIKHLPHGAGIGGGSMNAASLLHALIDVWQLPANPWPKQMLLALGADIAACLALFSHGWLRMGGIGEEIHAMLPPVAHLYAVLTHPGEGLSTPAVYGACLPQDYGQAMPKQLPVFADAHSFASWLSAETLNGLQAAAMRLSPHIAKQCHAIERMTGCVLARMTGSGSACFGVFAGEQAAHAAMVHLAAQHPNWWVKTCRLGVAASML